MRAFVALTTIAVLALPARASAQYFGQNHVQYRHLDFAIIGTEHFDVYYYDEEREAAIDAARMAERGYQRLSRILNHRYRERQPLILYASHSEFQQNNVTAVDDATGGVTEPFRHRILLPFTGSYAEFEHILLHEIVHQFQFDVFAGGHVGAGIGQLLAVSPPLWFLEGMAEYLSVGPIDPQTAMWLRDAAIGGRLPDLEALNWDPQANPYRFGHALWAYVGERWGLAAVGDILHATASAGVEGAFRRVLRQSISEVIADWHAAIRRTYLPQAANHWHAFRFVEPVLTRERSTGTLHVAPAVSPDGATVVYLSEGSTFFVDLYAADVWTGKVENRLIKSAFDSDFESLRFVNSAGSWSPDGRWFAVAAKNGPRDDIVIFDMDERRVNARVQVPLHGATNPSWSPDGTQLVFTGQDGGWSDLFAIKADGTDLRRLTDDAYADLHPVWSPDGTSIAFATDRGPRTDLASLEMSEFNIAILTLADGRIEIVPGMAGSNINPQWAPDGHSVAFVSDRTGTTNIFLYEFEDRRTYQITDVFTGVAGLTPLSPALSWAPLADRLLFTYYEHGSFNVYRIDDPRALKDQPWGPSSPTVTNTLVTVRSTDESTVEESDAPNSPGSAVYDHGVHTLSRSTQLLQFSKPDPAVTPEPTISVRALLNSATAELPDDAEFTFDDYRPAFKPEFVGATSVGYVRDNFGSGFYGGSSISLSDMLSNHRLMGSVAINGRFDEAQLFAAYANMSRRTNWTAGISMGPYFSYTGSRSTVSGRSNSAFATVERFIFREAFVRAHRPLSRFNRVEMGLKAVNLSHASLSVIQVFDPVTQVHRYESRPTHLGNYSYLQPTIALVFDNAVTLHSGPMFGRRSRLEFSPAFGEWQFHEVLADLRRYDRLGGPFTVATRMFFFGRFGRNTDQFPLFLGNTDLIRGYTAGSIYRDECRVDGPAQDSGCGALDQLIGSRMALFNAELRFPLLRQMALGFATVNMPLEGAVFFDAGMAWTAESRVVFQRGPGADASRIRHPLTAVGVAIRANLWGLMVLRADYAVPLRRSRRSGYVTISIGPTF